MKVLIAGATGVLGSRLVPLLVKAGHEAVGTSRSAERAARVERHGGRGIVLDALDRAAVQAVLEEVRPDAVVHALTALPPGGPNRPGDLAATNRLRTEGTRNLVDACSAAGVGRLVAESFIGVYGPGADEALSEETLPPLPPGDGADAARALRRLEEQVIGAGGIALRYGLFYGRGVPSTEAAIRRLRRRMMPMPGGAPGVASWIHADDAAAATMAALERAALGRVYNVVDDQPVTFGEFFDALAAQVGAPRPMRVPVALGRLVAPYATRLAVESRLAASNRRITDELGWRPTRRTFREGLRDFDRGALSADG
jgi:nucleoside-diphosphate-sugar epimerase